MKDLTHRLRFLISRPAPRVGLAMAALLLATPWMKADERPEGHFALVGTWITSATLAVTPPGFPSDKFQAIETFNSDGTMYVVSQIAGVTIGNGVWKSTGHNRYTFTFTFYRPDPSGLMLPVVVNENVRMTGDDTYVTTDVIAPLDAAGNPLAFFPGTVAAKRYPFANFNTTLP
jgi:hypothetical protein